MRTTRAGAFAALTLISLSAAHGDTQVSARPLAIVNATVIDVRAGRAVPGMAIVASGNRIAAVATNESVRLPAAAYVIDAADKYVIPGLWDMHAHLGAGGLPAEIDMPLLVANGVTGIREMWSDCYPGTDAGDCLAARRTWQRQIESGELLGPRILALAGWPVNGSRGLPKGSPAFFAAENAEQGIELARYFAQRRVDFVKIYPNISREGFFALAKEARRLGLGVAGHETPAVTAIEASDAGQQSFEHARVFLLSCFAGAAELARLGANATVDGKSRRRMVDEYQSGDLRIDLQDVREKRYPLRPDALDAAHGRLCARPVVS